MDYEEKYFAPENSTSAEPQGEMHEIKQQIQALVVRQEFMAIKLNEIANRQEELAEMLGKTNLLLQRSLGIVDDECSHRFPLRDVEDLKNFNLELAGVKRVNLIKAMHTLISNNLASNLGKIFSREVILNVNYDGTKGKIALKSFEIFIYALFEALCSNNFDQFLLDLRHALKINKNKLHKQTSRLNKTERDPLVTFCQANVNNTI